MSMDKTWVGIAGGLGVSVVGGISANFIKFVNMKNTQATMTCGVSGLRLGAVAHVGGNISLAILTGVKTRSDIKNLKSGGWDFAADFGAKWGAMVKAGGWAAKGLKALNTVSDLPKLRLWAGSEAGKNFVNFLTGDLEMSQTKPSFAMVGTPAGLGLGAGVWYEWQSVTALGGGRAWEHFKPCWRIVKHQGNHWLQIARVPEEDGKDLIVNFREDVWGYDHSLKMEEPFLDGWSSVISGVVRDNFLFEHSKSRAPVNNLPPHAGLNLTWRRLAGRWTRHGVEPIAAGTKLGIGLDVATGGKTVWEADKYITVTINSQSDIDNVVNPGDNWKR